MLSQEKKKRKKEPMLSHEKKRRKKKEPSPTLMSLPEDLLLSCLARVSRLYYPTLSVVSKKFRFLLVSPELYKIRSLLGQRENCLYVCIQLHGNENSSWYTLCRTPDETLTNKKLSRGYVLAKVPIPDFPCTKNSGLVAVGSSIYNFSPRDKSRSSSVSILDCRSHTCRKAPSLPVDLESLTATVVDQKIYVAGRYEDKDGSRKSSIEVLDTKTQIWNPIPIPCIDTDNIYHYSACIGGKYHVIIGVTTFVYDSKEGRWDVPVELQNMEVYIDSEDTYCVVDNVFYSAPICGLKWYDSEERKRWLVIRGLVGLPHFYSSDQVSVANYGGKMVVLWWQEMEETPNCPMNKIWCAEIALERNKYGDEMFGIADWVDYVL